MANNFTYKGIVSLCIFLFSLTSYSQSITASPQNVIRPVSPNTVSVSLDRISGGWGSSGTYVWTVSPSNGVTIGSYTQSGTSTADVTVTFSGAASGTYIFTLTRGSVSASVNVTVGNIAASSSSGDEIAVFNVVNGNYLSGPGEVFTPSVTSAALGLSATGYYYYLPNTYNGNDGNVTVYAASPNGTGSTAIGSIDLNGASNNDLGFVRLAIDPVGTGWILAGDNSTLYLGKFTTSGVNPTEISLVDGSVSLVNGTVSTFFNGDICISGNGTIYALGNSGPGGSTQIFIGSPNSGNTTLTKKWDLVNESGNPFSGSVNGVAFDAVGSLYISTSTGLYFINQYTVNNATGTVQCSLVYNVSGLTDLASNLYPQQSTLPVRLAGFTGNYKNQKTTLNWITEDEQNFSHFEIERSGNGNSYSAIAVQFAASNNNRQSYQYTDDLSAVNGTVFTYRLKMVDNDGQYKYSNMIMIRKETRSIEHITLNPNPVINMATVRFYAPAAGNVSFSISDVAGRTMLRQQNSVAEGNNSVSLNGLDRLLPGNYILQMINSRQIQSLKFTITK
ncbi:MAG: T9SS type A sorting domain-containing protein [Chitinophagaceae bacterium]|nr:T9SS type A sorting domain-containing protein [Chitinophagaceae bacterium]